MDPAYGDDLWAAGFSSEDEADDERGTGGAGEAGSGRGGSDLDLLASMMKDRGRGEAEGRVEGESGEGEKTMSFEESLKTPDEMSLMKTKMRDMEKELQLLRQQVSTGNAKRPHPQSHTPNATPTGGKKARHSAANDSASPMPAAQLSSSVNSTRAQKKSPPSYATSSVAMANRGKATPPPVCDRAVADELLTQRRTDQESNVTTDSFSGIRIKNPLVSSELMKKRMQGRKMIKIPSISSRVKGSDIEGDWVTIGVVVDKLPPRDSAKGNKYAVWKLSDLSSQSAVVSLFLFGKSYQEHWKMAQGSVVALLNPTIMADRETGTVDTSISRQLALCVDLAQKLMPLGISQDFTICRAHTKAGKKCTNFAKASDGGFCDYHIQGAYKKMRTGRMECQGGYGPSTTNLRGKLFKNSKTDLFFCGGKTFTSGSVGGGGAGGGAGAGSGGQEKRLFAHGVQASVAKVSQEVNEMKTERERLSGGPSIPAGRKLVTSEGGDLFKQMLGSQTSGARLLTRHIQQEEAKKQQAAKLPGRSASELLKDHKKERSQCRAQSHREDSAGTRSSKPAKPAAKPVSQRDSSSEKLSVRKRQSSEGNAETTQSKKSRVSPDTNPKQRQQQKMPQLRELERRECKQSGSHSAFPFQPRLGRGLEPGSMLDLSSSGSARSRASRKSSASKLKAAAVLKRQRSEEDRDGILSRVQENRARAGSHSGPGDGVLGFGVGDEEEEKEEEEGGPLSKRRKLDPAEVDMILNAKSSHEWAVREVEWEREEQYFSHLEKKENMEQRLASIRELRVYVSQCKQCSYVAEQPGELCRKEAHPLTRHKALKRWFECQECRERCCTYNARYPPFTCRKCSSQNFKQTSLFRERKGPSVGSENLLLRGAEEKFLK